MLSEAPFHRYDGPGASGWFDQNVDLWRGRCSGPTGAQRSIQTKLTPIGAEGAADHAFKAKPDDAASANQVIAEVEVARCADPSCARGRIGRWNIVGHEFRGQYEQGDIGPRTGW